MSTPSSERPLVTTVDALLAEQGVRAYREFLRVPVMSLGLFAPAPGHVDTQQPHEQDEVYLVVAGRAVLEIGGTRTPVAAGSIAYLPAGEPHRFMEISEDLRVVAVFSPPGPTP
ncbi:cupin domain-containing protein [Blastococcus haudaquaticus]|uniref:Cupin domain-containing protein n=1 Tax=Blastococcus haudaquaticus TaxID=1938745 RepID=A0A286GXX0_9ACTN|nr:cupin domain-containing protein [Blastococcus haudaquaticus]SOE00387.1 Cupin domain-containing protein [Blastococcus haudaquaticus]